jgi:hypothetical protein
MFFSGLEASAQVTRNDCVRHTLHEHGYPRASTSPITSTPTTPPSKRWGMTVADISRLAPQGGIRTGSARIRTNINKLIVETPIILLIEPVPILTIKRSIDFPLFRPTLPLKYHLKAIVFRRTVIRGPFQPNYK